jgi:ribonuclease HI
VTARGARHPLVAVFADESCLGNGREGSNPGGAGVLVEYRRPRSSDVVRRDLWVSESATTNNQMAIRSVIETFRALSRKSGRFSVVFTSDSRYLIDGLSDWVHGWARRGWTRKTGAIENLALWFEAIAAVNDHEVAWTWVRGHAGHPQNEYANHLATSAAASQSTSGGLVASQFDAWLADEARAHQLKEMAHFPTADRFRASPPLPPVPAGRP